MALRPSARLAAIAVAALVLSLIFTGDLARPLRGLALWLLVFAALEDRRELRRRLRVWTRQHRGRTILAAVVLAGLTAFWASQPAVHRLTVLRQLDRFSEEGRRLQADFASRVAAATGQPQGDITAGIQDWHARVDAWVLADMGVYYQSRLSTPRPRPEYPVALPARLRVFWDLVDADLAAIDEFRREHSGWLF